MEERRRITMPKLNPSMEDAVLVAWAKEPEEPIHAGDVLFEVETDKVVCEIEATEDGVLEKLCFEEGDRIRAGETVAVLKA